MASEYAIHATLDLLGKNEPIPPGTTIVVDLDDPHWQVIGKPTRLEVVIEPMGL